jgi:Zn-dependent M28 family amino/carboxypeptidase
MKTIVSAGLFLLPFAAAVAAPPASFDPQRLSNHVKVLASDAFEGRGPATAGETKTIAYIVDQMKAAGLQPGGSLSGGKRGWTQDVPLLRAAIEGTPRLSFETDGRSQPLAQGDQIAVRAAMTGAHHVSIAGAPLVFVGYGVKAPERNWDDFKGVDLHGKIMVVLVNDPDYETGQGDFGGKAMTYYGRWTYKYEEAARQGAAGVLVIHETGPASYGWNTVKNSNTNTQFDIVRKDPAGRTRRWRAGSSATSRSTCSAPPASISSAEEAGAEPRLPPGALEGAVQRPLRRRCEGDHLAQRRRPCVGAKHPDETLIYSAHWDHLGVGRPDARGDTIYNGAVDNATGVAALLEIGRAFASGSRPDRSVVFLAVTAEEKGLLGSEYYAANPLYPLGKTVGMINTDALGVAGPARNFSISGAAKLGLLDDLIAEGRSRGRTFMPEPHPENGGFYRSDHFSMAKRGVPAISFESGNDLVKGGTERGEALARAYTEQRYHQPADEWSADWDLTGMSQDLSMLYALGTRLANSREWPNWSPDSEFRAARDATAAARK